MEEILKKSRYLLFLLLTIFIQDAVSQNSQVLYYMNLPQNHLLNPAFRPSNSFYIGIPGITGINLNISNNFLNFSDVIMRDQKGDSLISFLHPQYNVDNFIKKLKSTNFFTPEVSVQLLGLGFNAGKDLYVSIDVIERVQGNFALPKELFILALKGDNKFVGKTINLSGLDARLKHFHEIGIGVSKSVGDKLRIGIRGKLLFGTFNLSLNNKSLGLTITNDHSYDLNADLSATISGPVKVYSSISKSTGRTQIDSLKVDEEKIKKPEFYLNKANIGLGIDVGAVYQVSDRISISASITDLGYIKWKNDVTTLKANSQFKFDGFNVTDVVNGTMTFNELAQDMLDSLKNSFTINKGNKPFKTNLPVGLSVGGSFSLSKSISFGILSHSVFSGRQVKEALTLSANVNLGNSLSTSFSYTAENSKFDNLGAGLAFRLGVVQFYLIADRIPVSWSRINTDSESILLPYSWNTINLRVGLNLAFGNKVNKKKDKPMIVEHK
jgi:hypothetical protein